MYSTGYSCQILMKLECSRQIFDKYLDMKFDKNLSSGSRVPRGRTDRLTDMTKLTVTLRNFENAPKMISGFAYCYDRELFFSSLLPERK
jgi:hypothetical protein